MNALLVAAACARARAARDDPLAEPLTRAEAFALADEVERLQGVDRRAYSVAMSGGRAARAVARYIRTGR